MPASLSESLATSRSQQPGEPGRGSRAGTRRGGIGGVRVERPRRENAGAHQLRAGCHQRGGLRSVRRRLADGLCMKPRGGLAEVRQRCGTVDRHRGEWTIAVPGTTGEGSPSAATDQA